MQTTEQTHTEKGQQAKKHVHEQKNKRLDEPPNSDCTQIKTKTQQHFAKGRSAKAYESLLVAVTNLD